MGYRVALLLIPILLFAQFPSKASATTYTCSKVEEKATLAYDGNDRVTPNHSDGQCSWSIGDSACVGCKPIEWARLMEAVRGLYQNSNGIGTFAEYFPSLVVAAQDSFGLGIGEVRLGEINCVQAEGQIDFTYETYTDSISNKNVNIGCVFFRPRSDAGPIIVGDDEIHATSDLLVIAVSGRDENKLATMFIAIRQ